MEKINSDKYDLDQIFAEATGYKATYDILKETIDTYHPQQIDLLTPMITSIIFSCELFMKLLIIHYDIDLENSHNLNSLFDKLPEDLQIDIEKNFNENILDKKYFRKTLKSNSTAYTYFRYYFSFKDSKSIHLKFFETFNDILYKKCKDIKTV